MAKPASKFWKWWVHKHSFEWESLVCSFDKHVKKHTQNLWLQCFLNIKHVSAWHELKSRHLFLKKTTNQYLAIRGACGSDISAHDKTIQNIK